MVLFREIAIRLPQDLPVSRSIFQSSTPILVPEKIYLEQARLQ